MRLCVGVGVYVCAFVFPSKHLVVVVVDVDVVVFIVFFFIKHISHPQLQRWITMCRVFHGTLFQLWSAFFGEFSVAYFESTSTILILDYELIMLSYTDSILQITTISNFFLSPLLSTQNCRKTKWNDGSIELCNE